MLRHPSSFLQVAAPTYQHFTPIGFFIDWKWGIQHGPILSMVLRALCRMKSVDSLYFGLKTPNPYSTILTSWRKGTLVVTFNTRWTITRKKGWKRVFRLWRKGLKLSKGWWTCWAKAVWYGVLIRSSWQTWLVWNICCVRLKTLEKWIISWSVHANIFGWHSVNTAREIKNPQLDSQKVRGLFGSP